MSPEPRPWEPYGVADECHNWPALNVPLLARITRDASTTPGHRDRRSSFLYHMGDLQERENARVAAALIAEEAGRPEGMREVRQQAFADAAERALRRRDRPSMQATFDDHSSPITRGLKALIRLQDQANATLADALAADAAGDPEPLREVQAAAIEFDTELERRRRDA